MRDSQDVGPTGRRVEDFSLLALNVVARLVARGGRSQRAPDPGLIDAMTRAVKSGKPAVYEALQPDLRRARISDIDLVDSYFPAVARQLGCDWADDRAGWAEVSIGVARLQSLVHEIARGWASPTAADGQSALVILPEGEQHSFGVQVLAAQLRRQGVSVHIQIGPGHAALAKLVQERNYDCALISVGSEDRLDGAGELVRTLKDSSNGRLKVAVGGAVLDRRADVLGVTRADIASKDPVEALGGWALVAGMAGARSGMLARFGASDGRLVTP